MSEAIFLNHNSSKEEKYLQLLPQLEALTSGETDLIANLSNTIAALKEVFNFFWVGAYLVKHNQFVLGPFQGPVACTRIAFTRGVCGASYSRKETIIVPDVEAFPDHTACSSASKSEIVIPIFKNATVVMVLDIDSNKLNDFDETDRVYLEKVSVLISNWF